MGPADLDTSGQRSGPFGRARASPAQDVIQRNGAGPEEDQGKCHRCRGHRELVAWTIWRSHQPVVQMHLPDGDRQVNANRECRSSSEESGKDEQAAEEFRKGRNITEPRRQAEAGDKLRVVMQSAKHLVIAMSGHDRAQRQAHHQQSQRLQTIEVTQNSPLRDLLRKDDPSRVERRIVNAIGTSILT